MSFLFIGPLFVDYYRAQLFMLVGVEIWVKYHLPTSIGFKSERLPYKILRWLSTSSNYSFLIDQREDGCYYALWNGSQKMEQKNGHVVLAHFLAIYVLLIVLSYTSPYLNFSAKDNWWNNKTKLWINFVLSKAIRGDSVFSSFLTQFWWMALALRYIIRWNVGYMQIFWESNHPLATFTTILRMPFKWFSTQTVHLYQDY